MLRKTISLFLLGLMFFTVSSVTADDSGPKETVKKLLDSIKKIKGGTDISKEQKDINQKLSDSAITLLDVEEVSEKALGKHWVKISKKEQKQFVALLSNLFKRVAFPNSGKFFAELDLNYGESQVNKTKALIPLTVMHKEEGEVDIDFKLHLANKKWKVYDVILDGVSMRNNLKSQFNKIIGENDYQELVRRMEDKLKKANT